MDKKDFVYILINPVWKWVGAFMDIIGLIIYINPELTDKTSFANLIQGYWWVWLIVGTIIWTFNTAWEAAKKMGESKKSIPEKPSTATREIKVSKGGTGSIVQNSGSGIGLEITHDGKSPAEQITVEGQGIGEIITNTGQGIGKRITSTGEGAASESKVIVTQPVQTAFGLSATVVLTACSKCGKNFSAQKVIQGFTGDSEPKVEVHCPFCHAPMWI
jgi:hypothetical protein